MDQTDGRQSAFSRLTPVIALTAALALLVAGVAMAWFLDRTYREQKIDEVSVQAAILATTVTAALSFADHQAGQEYVNALAVNPEVQVAAIYDAGGKPFVAFLRQPRDAIPDDPPRQPARFDGDGLTVTAPIVQGGATLGTVYLRTFTEPVVRRLERYGVIGLLVVMASLLVAVLGVAQAAQARANRELARQGEELAVANAALRAQIEQREKVEEALRQSQKMEAIGQLAGGIAHDFNNLLQVILGNLERLRGRTGDTERIADPRNLRLIESATRGADRAAALTKRLLAFSRRQTLAPTTVDVNRLVAGLSDLMLRTLGAAIKVETVLQGGVWQVSADENQLESALLNLAVNARDAMPNGEEEIAPGDYAQIAITDTGTGMTKDVLAKAFDPFFTTKDIGHGTGLGLSQVYGFVKQSGGHVRIISEPGQGTSVRLFLPRLHATAAVEPAATAGPLAMPLGSRHETILVVEDEDDVRMATGETLRELGYDVIEAPDGHVGLRRLEEMPGICLLFTDVGLPGGMNGVQLAEAARRRRPDLPVLFTTGYARDAFTSTPPLAGTADVLGKPFDHAALARRLREVLDGRKRETAAST